MTGSIGESESQAMDFESEAPLAAQSPSEEMLFREDSPPQRKTLKTRTKNNKTS